MIGEQDRIPARPAPESKRNVTVVSKNNLCLGITYSLQHIPGLITLFHWSRERPESSVAGELHVAR
jgi:hypothetical protein